MAVSPGKQLGSYEILSLLGAGGMGEVYRARDSKLGREVAVKVLPDAFAADPERLARFKREAHLLAALNHPNIATIHGLEESGGIHFLVMELVPGETLAERLSVGPLEVEEALGICTQIAEALEAAHEKGVIHRDLKPANVKVTPEGRVKVLDFGLAKAMASEAQANETYDSQSPTLSAMPTRAGVILGTAAYMSPEQARGKKVDKRTDIWAFGCVLYELLTGKQAFQSRDREGADTVQDIIARILQGEPDWQALPADTPAHLRFLLRRCLHKDVTKRFHSAADVRIGIEEALTAPATEGPAVGTPAAGWRRLLLQIGATAVAVAIITGIAVWQLRPAPPPSVVSRTVIPLREGNSLAGNLSPMLALSPDGTQLAFIAGSGNAQQIYVRAMDAIEARILAGTERAQDPFFSPDGEWIAFFADGKLKKVSVSGGAVLTLCDAPISRGGSWGPDDTIVFAPTRRGGLWEVPAAGGEPKELTKLNEGELSHRWPQLLPDGKTLIFTVATVADALDPAASNEIAALNLDTGEYKMVIRGGTFGRYVPTGHLVYYSFGTIMAAPFDPGRLEAGGAPAPVVEDVMSSTGGTGAGQFSISNLGSLVYVAGGNQQAASSLVWVDRGGTEEPANAPPRQYLRPRLSPDGQRLAVEIVGPKTDIWIYDLSRETLTPITFEGDKIQVAWTPDAKRIVYSSAGQADGTRHLYWKPADGTGSEELLTSNQYGFNAPSMTPDGKWLAYHEVNPETRRDIWGLPLEGERKPRPLLQEPFNESAPAFSPDGRWLAYASDESGQSEVYVRSFPGLEGKWRISTEGGGGPYWNSNGLELFYRSGNKMMAVDVTTQPNFHAGQAEDGFRGAIQSRPRWPAAQLRRQPRRPAFPDDEARRAANDRSDPDQRRVKLV